MFLYKITYQNDAAFYWDQVYFGVSTLLDASSSDGLKSEDEQKEVILP